MKSSSSAVHSQKWPSRRAINRGSKLRRVLIANPGADVYGSDLQMLETVRGLRAEDVAVTVACPSVGPLIDLLSEAGATVHSSPFPVVRRAYLSPDGIGVLAFDVVKALPSMVRLLRELKPDLVYVNTTTIPWWIVVSRLMRIPAVCHVHEAENADNTWVLRALNAPLLLADRLILISRTAADATWRVYPRLRSRSVIVLNGVPDRPRPPVPPPGSANKTHIAIVGRLSPRKGTKLAVEATAMLIERGYDVKLEVAGTVFPGYEWYEEELRAIAQGPGLREAVTFTGYVSPSFKAFDRADIVLAPSLREPFGNAVVEAQLSERPVVAAAAGGHLESINDGATGLLVPVDDVPAFVDAILFLIADRQAAQRMGVAARLAAQQAFGVTRYKREILLLLNDVVHGNASKDREDISPGLPVVKGRRR